MKRVPLSPFGKGRGEDHGRNLYRVCNEAWKKECSDSLKICTGPFPYGLLTTDSYRQYSTGYLSGGFVESISTNFLWYDHRDT